MDDRERMRHPAPWVPWALTSAALIVVAVIAYGLGAQHGDGAAAPSRVWWFFPGWMFFLFFWIFLGGVRRIWWWGWYPYRPWRHRGYFYQPYGPVRDAQEHEWDEWHRRAHDRMGGPPPGGPESRSTL
jgi:hypothetical protein